MDKGKHPKVIRAWISDRIRKPEPQQKTPRSKARKPEAHNKT